MIKLNSISKKFGDLIVLDDLSLEIEKGELVAIVGDSGSGKTTVLNILGMLDFAYEGTIEYNGVSFKEKNQSEVSEFIRYNINYLFQNYALVDEQTVLENLMYALYYTDKTKREKENIITDVLIKVGLAGVENKKIYMLSGGEQQRVALARLIIKPGDIILADEPTGNLDKNNRLIVLSILKSLNEQGKTVVIVTHDESIANECSRVITLTSSK